MKQTIKSRLSAAGIHFILSLIVISALVAIVIKLWYPQPYFSASGGWQGLRIVALVDLVLGPLITLAIFDTNKPKKSLVQDLSIIVILQLSALFYGISTIYTQRPVAVAFWENKFLTVSADDLEEQGFDLENLQQFSKDIPAILFVEKPTDIKAKKAMLKVIKEQQIAPIYQTNLYRPIQIYFPEMLKWGVNIDEIISINLDIANQLETLLDETKTKKIENIYLPMESKYQNVILVFNDNAEMIGYLKAPYKTIE